MNKLLSVVLATILVLFGTVVPVSAETVDGTNTTSRLAGQNHYQTSVAIAEDYNNNGDCGNVILASGDSFPDALSASILSKKMNAPILLVGTTVNTSSDAFNYLYTHESRQRGTVYIIGGTGVIGPDFETKLASMMFTNIKRLDGTDRYDTNILIVNEVNVLQGTPVFIASGENFPDALSISSFSGSKQYPTLLVGADYLPEQTKDYLLSEKPSAVYIAGGTSVVSQDIENQINVLVPGSTVTRMAGDDRFGTNVAVLKEFSPTPDIIYLANGDDFSDVLAGSALAAKTGKPIMLVDNQLTNLPPAAETHLKELNDSGIQTNLIALGGTDVVSDILCQQFENVFSGSPGLNDISTSRGATGTDNSALIEKQQKAGPSRITQGRWTSYYLDSGGHVWVWGDGARGELGNGTTGTQLNPSDSVNPIFGSTVPVEISKLANIVSIAAGGNTCYALDNSGHVWAWGDGTYGQLGNGTKGNQLNTGQYPIYGSTVPVQVSNLKNIVSIAASQVTGYALDSSGQVWSWGGQDIYGEPTTAAVPTQVPTLMDIVSISADAQGNEAFAFDSSGQVWAWGHFGSGITVGGVYQSTSRTQTPVPIQLTNLKDIIAIAYEGLGDNGIWHASTGNAWGIETGDQLWYALDSSGQVWAWEFGYFGANDWIKTTPVKVSNLSNIVSIVGRGEDYSTDCYNSGYALDSSGRVWSWGDGDCDKLGKDGTVTQNQSTPVRVISNIVKITGNNENCYALDSSGRVWAWGQGSNGQLGNGTITDSNVPVQVLGLPK
ncbi:MAG: cell wall-binding repeat-containing protein [Desulfosporosinus sp.]|nr:cell wall-binding repeat-containing protein [Desulfosporosinus sp.]